MSLPWSDPNSDPMGDVRCAVEVARNYHPQVDVFGWDGSVTTIDVVDATDHLDDWDFLQVDPAAPCRHYLLVQDRDDNRKYRCEVCANVLMLRPIPARRWETP